MALTINTQILGQEATNICTYCYLYEPLRVVLNESDLSARKLFIDLEVIDTTDNSNIIETLLQYGDYDINPGNSLSIDLMKLAQQHHDANVLNFSSIDDIIGSIGWQSVVSKYKYNFKIYTDITVTPVSIIKLPILGVRKFEDFTAQVTQASPLTELDLYSIDLSNRWKNYSYVINSLSDPSATDSIPSITKSVPNTNGSNPCGGFLIWKSRFGGWSSWGFDIKTESDKHKYESTLDVGMFESTLEVDGNPYISANYTGVNMEYTKTLKALSLPSNELLGVNGINASSAVYYMKDSSGTLELMRLNSATVPISSLSNGGDFSVSLKSISATSIKTK